MLAKLYLSSFTLDFKEFSDCPLLYSNKERFTFKQLL